MFSKGDKGYGITGTTPYLYFHMAAGGYASDGPVRLDGNSEFIIPLSDANAHGIYSAAQRTEYGTQQYNAGRTTGQNDVKNSPNTYSLYTKAQYDANYNSGTSNGATSGPAAGTTMNLLPSNWQGRICIYGNHWRITPTAIYKMYGDDDSGTRANLGEGVCRIGFFGRAVKITVSASYRSGNGLGLNRIRLRSSTGQVATAAQGASTVSITVNNLPAGGYIEVNNMYNNGGETLSYVGINITGISVSYL